MEQIGKLREVAESLPGGSPERKAIEDAIKTLEKQL